MSTVFFLDSGPLSLVAHPQRSLEVVAFREWVSRCFVDGSSLIVPAIIYYELKRELLRANKISSIQRIDSFIEASPGRYEPLSDGALRLAADLWAQSQRAGQPTADQKALDVDVILAAQALLFEPARSEVVIVTTNPKHLSRFIASRRWDGIS